MAGEITAPYLPPQGPEYDTEVQKAGPLLSRGDNSWCELCSGLYLRPRPCLTLTLPYPASPILYNRLLWNLNSCFGFCFWEKQVALKSGNLMKVPMMKMNM